MEGPLLVVGNLEEDDLPRAERVDETQPGCSDHCAEEAAEHDFCAEVVGYLLEGEEDAAYGRAKGYSYACCACGGEDLASFALVVLVLAEEAADDVAYARGDVDEGAFFAEGEARGDGEGEADGFGKEGAIP